MPLFVTVTPGTTVTNSTTLDATVLNLLGTPSVDVTGTVDGGSLSLSAGSVGTTQLADDAVTFAKMQNIDSDRLLGRDTAGTGDVEQLTVGGGLQFSGTGGIEIGNGSVTYAKVQNTVNGSRLIGRAAAAGGTLGEIEVGTGLSLSTGGVLSNSATFAYKQVTTNTPMATLYSTDAGATGRYSISHGFAQVPHIFKAHAVCTTNDGPTGYTAGDEVPIEFLTTGTGEVNPISLTADSSQITVMKTTAGEDPGPIIMEKTTGPVRIYRNLDKSKWAVKVSAILFTPVTAFP